MDISVIIPTFKPGNYIYECLDSLLRQTLDQHFWEIIIVINGKKEPFYTDIHKKYAGTLANLKIIYCDTANVSIARNIGIDNSKGAFITFLDDDDFISDYYLEGMRKRIINCNSDIIISNAKAFNDFDHESTLQYGLSKLYYKLQNKRRISLLASRSFFNGPCMKLIKRDIIGNIRFNKTFRNSEDALFMYQVSSQIKQIYLSEQNAIYYRRFRDSSAVTSKKKISYVLYVQFRFMFEVLRIYISNPTKYNIPFTISRLLAGIKSMIIQILGSIF